MVDLTRVAALLEQHGLDGMLIVDPENFTYFAGTSAFPVTIWRRAGPACVVVSQDGTRSFIAPDSREADLRLLHPDALLLTHPLWMERVDTVPYLHAPVEQIVARATAGRDDTRYETYDEATVLRLVRSAITSAGLLGTRLGIELESAPALDIERIRSALGDTLIVNASPLIRELRMIKTPREIELHRLAARITEAGISDSLEGLDEHTSAFDIQARFRDAVNRIVVAERIVGFEWAATTLNLGPHLWGAGYDPLRLAQRGDLIQFDSGVRIHGTMSDVARTFSFGTASPAAQFIENALLAGHAAGLEHLKPGRRFADVFNAASEAVRANGIPSYARGHLGHSIGSVYIEEWPFFSATEQRELEPGMVVAFEVPYYANGIGGFQNENNYLITKDGHESFNSLPMALDEVGGRPTRDQP